MQKTQQRSKQKNNIKITQIPLSLQINPNIGVINFLSQKYGTIFQKPIIKVQPHIEQITFKNAIGKGSQSQQSQNQQFIRKKVIQKNRIILKPQNMKRKYFKVDIPLNKGASTGAKNYKQKTHFVIQFGNDNKGTLTIVDDVYDSQIEIISLVDGNNQKPLSLEEKMKLQDSKLDARRRQERIDILEEKKDGRKKEK